MLPSLTRRQALKTGLVSGAYLGLGDLGFLTGLKPVSAQEAALDPHKLRLGSGIDPVVRMIEETPRERLLEEVAANIRRGLSYQDLLAGLLLAGVKNIEPRPSVGFKFHAVLVVNSAHLASMASPAEHRWLPIFWALDHYKTSAARDVAERGDWTMAAADEAALPAAHKAHDAFQQAMDQWDEAAADAAVAQLARTAGMNELYETLWLYGARDFRSIGHKAIYVANSYRTLQCIGSQHAEPVVRSLAYALLMHEEPNPAQSDYEADRPFRRNEGLVERIRPDWLSGTPDPAATETMLQTLRTGSNDDACDQVVELLNAGAAPQSIWDALHLDAAEMLMQQPEIVALHGVTTTNALHYAYQVSGNNRTRQLMMLQNAAFLPMFRQSMQGRGSVKATRISDLEPAAVAGQGRAAIDEIFAALSSQPLDAAQKLLGYLRQADASPRQAQELIDAARVLVFLKGNDAHDYKFSSAILEDYYHVSPQVRDVYLAANIFKLRGSGDRDNRLVERTRAALES